MPDVVLALDQGTTGTTALVLSKDGAILGRAYAEFSQSYPEPGWVEHDPEEIWDTSCSVMAGALRGAGVGAGELKGIGVTNQRETTVVWDRATGIPVYPAIVWQSRQSLGICERLSQAGYGPLVRDRTGLVIDAYFSGTKVAWILDRVDPSRARARDGTLLFGTIDTWLLWKLTGVHASDPTNASRTLLYDIHAQRWDPDLLEMLDVPVAMLPSVRPSCGPFGETRPVGELPGGIRVAGVAGDQQAALYGQGCWDAGSVKSTYGTGCFVVMNCGAVAPSSQHGLITTLCCDAGGGVAYALEGSIFVAGAAVQWLRDQLGLIQSAAETDGLAQSVPDTKGVYLVPAFTGLGSPYWDMNARGALVGLTRGAGRAEIVRATLESMAYQTRDVIEAVVADADVTLDVLKVDGGASANDFLMQFQADVLGVPVDRPAIVETTGLGAAFLAGLGVGFWDEPAAISRIRRRERLFEPRMSASERDARYAGWKQAVRQVRFASDSGSDG